MNIKETSQKAANKIAKRLTQVIRESLRPIPKLNLVEWADKYRYLPDNSAEPGRWKTLRVEAARQPMLSVSDNNVQEITIMSCIQFMKTELMLNTALFYIHQEPSPIMYVAPKKDMAEAWSKERLVKSVAATPVVSDVFSSNRRGEGNTITQKQFPGGQISIVSARNPGDLAMRACMIMLFDEIDKYPVNVGSGEGGSGGEGDSIVVAWGRATTYGKRAKKICACSPTVEGKSRIAAEYAKSNMSVFYQPCPHCDYSSVLTWPDVHLPKNEKTGDFIHNKAAIRCKECGSLWTESDRHKSIRDGYWVATKPEITWHHGYKVSSLASPFTPISTLAKEFSDAQGSQEALKAFYNTRMAETWKEVGDQPDWSRLYERREDYQIGMAQKGVLLITAAADVHKNYIMYEVVGWGRKKESWSLEIGVIQGNIDDDDVKEQLGAVFDKTYKNEIGVEIPISKALVDSGYNTNEVYAFCRGYGVDKVSPIKGEKDGVLRTVLGVPKHMDLTVDGQRITRGVMLWPVGSSVIKEQIYRWLGAKKPTDSELENGKEMPTGYCHFPQYDEEYFKQLTAEQQILQVDSRGFHRYIWDKTRPDNHYLDCRVYNRAAAAMLGIDRMSESDWVDFEEMYTKRPVIDGVVEGKSVPRTHKSVKRENWIKRR